MVDSGEDASWSIVQFSLDRSSLLWLLINNLLLINNKYTSMIKTIKLVHGQRTVYVRVCCYLTTMLLDQHKLVRHVSSNNHRWKLVFRACASDIFERVDWF